MEPLAEHAACQVKRGLDFDGFRQQNELEEVFVAQLFSENGGEE